MGYFALLSKGSQFHKAELVKRGLKISPADGRSECIEAFQRIVHEAEENSVVEGYEIESHNQLSGECDFAVIWFNRPRK